jgi:hypothetical protein
MIYAYIILMMIVILFSWSVLGTRWTVLPFAFPAGQGVDGIARAIWVQ